MARVATQTTGPIPPLGSTPVSESWSYHACRIGSVRSCCQPRVSAFIDSYRTNATACLTEPRGKTVDRPRVRLCQPNLLPQRCCCNRRTIERLESVRLSLTTDRVTSGSRGIGQRRAEEHAMSAPGAVTTIVPRHAPRRSHRAPYQVRRGWPHAVCRDDGPACMRIMVSTAGCRYRCQAVCAEDRG